MKGIGGSLTVIGDAKIHIPFVELGIIIDVTISILEKNTPFFLSTKDVSDKVLYISWQKHYLHKGSKCQLWSLERNFSV